MVGKKDVLVTEIIPAQQVKGNRIDKIISRTVIMQLCLSEEKYKTMKTRTAMAKADTHSGTTSGFRMLCKASVVDF